MPSCFSCVQPSVTPWTAAARLLCPWGSPGRNTGVGCRARLQRIVLTQGWNPRPLGLLHWQVGSLPPAPPGLSLKRENFECVTQKPMHIPPGPPRTWRSRPRSPWHWPAAEAHTPAADTPKAFPQGAGMGCPRSPRGLRTCRGHCVQVTAGAGGQGTWARLV